MEINVSQVQRLLAAMGKSPGAIDGIWGRNSQAALDAACLEYGVDTAGNAADASATDANVGGNTGTWWDTVKYFKREEFRCRCPRCGGFPAEPWKKLVLMADDVRGHFNAPASVSSGVRCAAHNAEVGGVYNSRHLTGQAMDFCIKGKPSREILIYVQSHPSCAYAYAIDENFVHMDVIA